MRSAAALALGVILCQAVPARARAQSPLLTIRGQVSLEGDAGPRPVRNTLVTLHGLGPRRAGPVDSVRTNARGAFEFRILADTLVTYVATARHGGIAYFAAPIRGGEVTLAPAAHIAVFDTSSQAIPIRTVGRHVIVGAPAPGGMRTIVDVYELQNDASRTRVAAAELPVFTAPVPALATRVQSTQGDYTGAAIRAAAGAVAIVAPFPPGVRQLVLSYELPTAAFPLTVVANDTSAVFEVLVEETAGQVAGPGVEPVGAVTVEGRNFLRFLGQNVPAGTRATVTLPAAGGSGSTPMVIALLALVTLGGIVVAGRRPARPAARSRGPALREAIAGVDQLLVHASEKDRPGLRAYRDVLAAESDAIVGKGGAPALR